MTVSGLDRPRPYPGQIAVRVAAGDQYVDAYPPETIKAKIDEIGSEQISQIPEFLYGASLQRRVPLLIFGEPVEKLVRIGLGTFARELFFQFFRGRLAGSVLHKKRLDRSVRLAYVNKALTRASDRGGESLLIMCIGDLFSHFGAPLPAEIRV